MMTTPMTIMPKIGDDDIDDGSDKDDNEVDYNDIDDGSDKYDNEVDYTTTPMTKVN